MSDSPSAREREPKPIGGDLVIPVAGIAFTLYYFHSILEAPWEAQVGALFVGAILIVLGVIFIVVAVRRVAKGAADWGMGVFAAPRRLLPKRLALLALTVGYIAVIPWLGFTITTFLFLFAGITILKDFREKGLNAWLALAMALGGYLLFVVAFKTRFPEGPFEMLIDRIF